MELELIEVKPEKTDEDKLKDTMEVYHKLNTKLDIILEKIRKRRNK